VLSVTDRRWLIVCGPCAAERAFVDRADLLADALGFDQAIPLDMQAGTSSEPWFFGVWAAHVTP
jgi:hypothetical protein